MIIIDSLSFLNGILLVLVYFLECFYIHSSSWRGLTGVSVQQPRGLFYIEMKPELTMVTAFVGQTFEVGTCIFSALCITHMMVLWNSYLGIQLQKRKNKHSFFFCQVIRWKARNGNMHKYCRKHLQAFAAFRNLGLKTWTLSLQSQHHQSSLTKCITQIEQSIIASLLCPHRVNEILFFVLNGHF